MTVRQLGKKAKKAHRKQQEKINKKIYEINQAKTQKQQFINQVNAANKILDRDNIPFTNDITEQDLKAMQDSNFNGYKFVFKQTKQEYIEALESVTGFDLLIEYIPEYSVLINTIKTMDDAEYGIRESTCTDLEVLDPITTFDSVPLQLDSRSEKVFREAEATCKHYIEEISEFWNTKLTDEQQKIIDDINNKMQQTNIKPRKKPGRYY